MRPNQLRFRGVGSSLGCSVSDGEGVSVASSFRAGPTSGAAADAACGLDAARDSCAAAPPANRHIVTSKVRLRLMRRLISKRCKSCQTLYQSAMKAVFASIIITFLAISASHGKSRHSMLRLHAEANPQDTSTFSTSVRAKLSGKDVAIEKIARISEQDVVAFYPYPAGNGNYGALFQLDEHGRIALDALSVERRGGFLFVFVNGRAITELQIDKRVSDGRIYIPSGLTAADVQLMKKDWRLIGQRRR